MVTLSNKILTLSEFLALPNDNYTYELVEGKALPKISPKRFHSRITLALSFLLEQWNQLQEKKG